MKNKLTIFYTKIKKPLRPIKRTLTQLFRTAQDILTGRYKRMNLKLSSESSHYANLWSSYSISVPGKGESSELFDNRMENFRIVASRVNNRVLEPGDIFSFFYTIGKPTAKQGYKKALYLDGVEVKSAIAGSLCLVTTLLYNIALEANLEILERHPHVFDSYTDKDRYYGLGRDATCSFGYKDVRFKNNTKNPIQLKLVVEEDRLIGEVMGESDLRVKVQIDTEVLEYIDRQKLEDTGTSPQKGYDGKIIRVVRTEVPHAKLNNKVVNHTTVDSYEMVPEVIS